MKKFFFFFSFWILMAAPTCSFSQYTDVINSNRPGTSFSAYSVGTKVYQGEFGMNFGHDEHNLFDADVDYFDIEYAFRWGVWREQFEVILNGSYQIDQLTDRGQTFTRSGPMNTTLGAKYLFFDPQRKRKLEEPNLYSWKANQGKKFKWKNLVPALSGYAGANIRFNGSPYVYGSNFNFFNENEADISGKIMLITQSHITSDWVFVTNFIYDRIGTNFTSTQYILTLTHAFNIKWAAFVENQGISSDFYSDNIVRFGGAYLLNSNLQFDATFNFNTKDTPSRNFGGVGVSYRLDYHESKWELVDDGKKLPKNELEQPKKKKGWPILRWFKKKEQNVPPPDEEIDENEN